jgi:hypothetical protein
MKTGSQEAPRSIAAALVSCALVSCALVACALLAAFAHRAAAARRPVSAADQLDLPALPSRVLGPLSFGLKSVVADVFFLDAIQANGARRLKDPEEKQQRQDRAMTRALTTALDLDPKFEVAYRFAGYAGPRQMPDGHAYNVLAMLPLLEKGVRECPGDWRIPFLLGFYQSYYLGKMADAAQNMGIAARRPKAPAYLGLLATRLAADANELQTAERMAIAMMQESDDPDARAQWEARIVDLHMERDLHALEAAAHRYRDRTGRFPQSPQALVAAGDLPALPMEPHGGSYSIDAQGQAHSSASQRLRVRGRQGTTSGLEVH